MAAGVAALTMPTMKPQPMAVLVDRE